MSRQLGSFNLAYTVSTPDMTLDHVFAGARHGDTRYEQFQGQDGQVDVNITLPANGDDCEALEAITNALKGAGFTPEFGELD